VGEAHGLRFGRDGHPGRGARKYGSRKRSGVLPSHGKRDTGLLPSGRPACAFVRPRVSPGATFLDPSGDKILTSLSRDHSLTRMPLATSPPSPSPKPRSGTEKGVQPPSAKPTPAGDSNIPHFFSILTRRSRPPRRTFLLKNQRASLLLPCRMRVKLQELLGLEQVNPALQLGPHPLHLVRLN